MKEFKYNFFGKEYISNLELTEKEIKYVEDDLRKKQIEKEKELERQKIEQEKQNKLNLEQQDRIKIREEQTQESSLDIKKSEQDAQPFSSDPRDFDNFFNEAAIKYKVNPRVLKSIAKVESGFRDDVITGKTLSEKGAEGMMQFMPATRKSLEEKYNVTIDPFDPQSSINGAALLLNELLTKYEKAGSDNPLGDALEDYNGGPRLVGKSQQTADYKNKVLSNLVPKSTVQEVEYEEPENPLKDFKEKDIDKPLVGQTLAEQKDVQEIKYKDLHEDSDYFNIAQDYMESRFGKEGAIKKGESKKDYIGRFATHMRNVGFNTLDLGKEALWTSQADREQKRKAGFAFEMWQSVPSFDDNKFKAVKDIAGAFFSDPMSYLGLGVGKVTTMIASKAGSKYFAKSGIKLVDELGLMDKSELVKRALKSRKARPEVKGMSEKILEKVEARARRTGMGLAGVSEGAVGFTSGLMSERLAVSQERQEEISTLSVALQTGMSTVFGASTGLSGAKFKSGALKSALEYEEILKGKKVKLKPEEEKLVNDVSDYVGKVTKRLDTTEGDVLLKNMSKRVFGSEVGDDLLSIEVRNDIVKKSFGIAGAILKSDPAKFGYKIETLTKEALDALPKKEASKYKVGDQIFTPPGEIIVNSKGDKIRVEDAITETLSDIVTKLDTFDDVTIDRAANLSGTSAKQFNEIIFGELKSKLEAKNINFKDLGPMEKSTISNAGRTLAQAGVLKRTLNKMARLDPRAQELLDSLDKNDIGQADSFGVLEKIVAFEKKSKVLVTSGIATTVRNVVGTTVALSANAAADVFETGLYTILKPVALFTNKTGLTEIDTKILNTNYNLFDSVKNQFELFTSMSKYEKTSAIVENMLSDNPSIRNQLVNTLQETGTQDVGKYVKLAATFNLTQDAFFRRTIFLSSVKQQMKKIGQDVDQFVANKKPIPSEILQRATDDAMKMTFTSRFKRGDINVAKSFEGSVESATGTILKYMESFPGMSLLVTFPRFMANAIAFQYRYSPLGGLSGAKDMLVGATKGNTLQFKQGTQEMSKGMVGTGMLAYALVERKNALYNNDPDRPVTKWYESLNDDGSMGDIRPLFPLAPYFAIADYLIKSDILNKIGMPDGDILAKVTNVMGITNIDEDLFNLSEVERDIKFRRIEGDFSVQESIEAIAGIKIPAGTQGFLLDGLVKAFTDPDAERSIAIGVAKVVSDFFGRVIQPGKPLVDFLSQLTEEGTVARDPNYINILDKEGLVPGSVKIGTNRFLNKLPFFKESLPEATNYFRKPPPDRPMAFFSNFTGVNVTPKLNQIESELEEHSIKPWKFFRPTGLRAFDKALIGNSYSVVAIHLNRVLDTEGYESMSYNQKQYALKQALSEAIKQTTELTIKRAENVPQYASIIPKRVFDRLSRNEKTEIKNRYRQDNNNKDIEEEKDFMAVYEYLGFLDNLKGN